MAGKPQILLVAGTMWRDTEWAKASRMRGTRSDGHKRNFAVYGTVRGRGTSYGTARHVCYSASCDGRQQSDKRNEWPVSTACNVMQKEESILHRVKRRGSVTSGTPVGYQHGVETPQVSLR
jgi:hypothetical protein